MTKEDWHTALAKLDQFQSYLQCCRLHLINNNLFSSFTDSALFDHFKKRVQSDALHLILSANECIGFIELGDIDNDFGIARFCIDQSYRETGGDVIRSITDAVHDGSSPFLAISEEQYYPAFAAAGYSRVGSRSNRILSLQGTKLPELPQTTLPQLSTLDEVPTELIAECFLESYLGGVDMEIGLYLPATIPAFLEYCDSIRAGDFGLIIPQATAVVFDNDRVLAALIVCENTRHGCLGKSALVVEFAVHPAVRRRGIGRTLLLRACEELAHLGFADVLLQHTDGNQASAALYERIGFHPIGERVVKSIHGNTRENAPSSI